MQLLSPAGCFSKIVHNLCHFVLPLATSPEKGPLLRNPPTHTCDLEFKSRGVGFCLFPLNDQNTIHLPNPSGHEKATSWSILRGPRLQEFFLFLRTHPPIPGERFAICYSASMFRTKKQKKKDTVQCPGFRPPKPAPPGRPLAWP